MSRNQALILAAFGAWAFSPLVAGAEGFSGNATLAAVDASLQMQIQAQQIRVEVLEKKMQALQQAKRNVPMMRKANGHGH